MHKIITGFQISGENIDSVGMPDESNTAGNDVVATKNAILFFLFFFLFPSRPFLIDRVLGSKNFFSKS